jgi:hemoglobin
VRADGTLVAMTSVYDAAGGRAGLERLAAAWHERVMADPVVSHAFHGGARPDHAERLASYWAECLGGPASYSARYGDASSVVRMHAGNGEHPEMDEAAVACFAAALDDVGLEDPVRTTLHDYFAWATTVPLGDYPRSADDVPEGLAFPRWGWDGPVAAET